jgi:hypothetical protein
VPQQSGARDAPQRKFDVSGTRSFEGPVAQPKPNGRLTSRSNGPEARDARIRPLSAIAGCPDEIFRLSIAMASSSRRC